MIIELVLTFHFTMIFNIDGSLGNKKPNISYEFDFISYYLNLVQNVLDNNFESVAS